MKRKLAIWKPSFNFGTVDSKIHTEKYNVIFDELRVTRCLIVIYLGLKQITYSPMEHVIQFTYGIAGLEISENRHLPCITKFIGIHGEKLIFSRNFKIFTCPAA